MITTAYIFDFYTSKIFNGVDFLDINKDQSRSYYVTIDQELVAALTVVKKDTNLYNRKALSNVGEIDHIWLCGILEEYRGMKLFNRLIDDFKKDATEYISVSIVPSKWPNLYAWIQKKKGKLVAIEDRKQIFIISKGNL
jgi:hypothetical protein